MIDKPKITTLLLDIGGVLMTNGWGHESRKEAAKKFGYSYEETEERHKLLYYMHEEGRLSLEEYLQYVYFFKERSFTRQQFKEFMFAQSIAYPDMLSFMRQFSQEHQLNIGILSNEGRDLADYRIKKFELSDIADFFIVSSYIGVRKPSPKIYALAMDIAYAKAEEICYVDDRQLLVEMACDQGLKGIHHTSLESTQKQLAALLDV